MKIEAGLEKSLDPEILQVLQFKYGQLQNIDETLLKSTTSKIVVLLSIIIPVVGIIIQLVR